MKKIVLGICIAMLLLLVGCGEDEHPEGSTCYTLYYVSNDSTKLITKEYWTTTTDENKLFEELRQELTKVPEKLEYTPPFGNNVVLRKWKSQNGRLLLDFEASYAKLTAETEVLTRAAIVKTFTQIKGINYISFQIEGKDLEDNLGKLVGAMYSDSFIYNEGAQINSYEEITLNLYFANEDGDALVKTEKTEAKTASGIIIPDTAQEKTQVATVIAIGDDKEKIKVVPGQKVMYDKYSGTPVKIDGEDHLILKAVDVIAVIE